MTDLDAKFLELYRSAPEWVKKWMILSAALSACANEAAQQPTAREEGATT